jgi:hypothetical protein
MSSVYSITAYEYMFDTFWVVGCRCMALGLSVSRKEWIPTAIFRRRLCSRKQVTEGFFLKKPKSFYEIAKGGSKATVSKLLLRM